MIALLSATLGLRVPPPPAASAVLSRRGALFAGLAAASGLAPPAALAAEATKECLSGCFKECNSITKSGAYCSEQCDSYCSEEGAKGADDVLRSDVTGQTAEKKDCSTYKTDKAKAWCAGENERTLAALRSNDIDKNLGLFGDSGVTYGKGLEDLFATAFGATRQSQPLNSADIGSFADEIGAAASRAGRK
tara:strand:+ start:313 stop:885 length:573 start_codon:yes stop_codon:yes gene_type:complete